MFFFFSFFHPNFYDEIKQKALLHRHTRARASEFFSLPHLHIYVPRLRTSEFPHRALRTNTFLTYSRFYSLPRDTISLQIKDNGGQVNTGCTETVSNSAALSHPRHTDVEISCKGSSSHTGKKKRRSRFYRWARWRRGTDLYFHESKKRRLTFKRDICRRQRRLALCFPPEMDDEPTRLL